MDIEEQKALLDTHICTPKVISALHRRFPSNFTPALITVLASALVPSNKAALAAMAHEQREKEEAARVARQRPIIRVCAELALVGVIRDAPSRSGAEWVMKVLRDLVRFFHYANPLHAV
jgi:regulator of nonsense transcripts 2